jgi:hypothetical protein
MKIYQPFWRELLSGLLQSSEEFPSEKYLFSEVVSIYERQFTPSRERAGKWVNKQTLGIVIVILLKRNLRWFKHNSYKMYPGESKQ